MGLNFYISYYTEDLSYLCFRHAVEQANFGETVYAEVDTEHRICPFCEDERIKERAWETEQEIMKRLEPQVKIEPKKPEPVKLKDSKGNELRQFTVGICVSSNMEDVVTLMSTDKYSAVVKWIDITCRDIEVLLRDFNKDTFYYFNHEVLVAEGGDSL